MIQIPSERAQTALTMVGGAAAIRIPRAQNPADMVEPTRLIIAMERANWMMRRVSLEDHIPTGEMCGGAGLEASILRGDALLREILVR